MTDLRVENLGKMSPDEEESFWKKFEAALANDDGTAAREHLAAGRYVTYRDSRNPSILLREWPDGKIEKIVADENGDVTVI
jgi:hypothetical protein